jgi:hypothetical protein
MHFVFVINQMDSFKIDHIDRFSFARAVIAADRKKPLGSLGVFCFSHFLLSQGFLFSEINYRAEPLRPLKSESGLVLERIVYLPLIAGET